MKEQYIKPEMKWANLYQETLMTGLSEKIVNDDDEEEYPEAANESFFEDYEKYWKRRIWK